MNCQGGKTEAHAKTKKHTTDEKKEHVRLHIQKEEHRYCAWKQEQNETKRKLLAPPKVGKAIS